MRITRHVAIGLAVLGMAGAGFSGNGASLTPAIFGGIQARSIGPAVMSGRIAALDAVPGAQLTLWIGAAGGGVWKSVNGGVTFKPVFDTYTQSIGAIRVDRSHPGTVWVGTGESWMRNSVSIGDGVYKTTDGGATWQHAGLEKTEHIARIVIDPTNSKRVFVCATGHLWNANPERGVYRTTDGGATWKKVLYVDENTGCSDLAIDPQEPNVLYAGMWQFRRSPGFFNSGGPGSGLYRSTDGGTSWTKLTAGLPRTELGRIAVAVAPSRPSVVYAVVESKDTALYRSDDLGEHWTKRSTAPVVQARPFYFAALTVDPNDFNVVYKPGFSLGISDDGGVSFSGAGGSYHGDVHAVWVDPTDSHRLLIGTDGGAYLSTDRGNHWQHLRNLPVSQFYHVSVDNAVPYRVYGGLQDNGSWMGPSRSPGGIRAHDWSLVGFGDGFWAFADPTDPDVIYSESQGGELGRFSRSTGESKDIAPYPGEGEPKLRFNWNTPVVLSETHPGTLYVGAQYLFRSRDRGDSWERISPDLTTNAKSGQRQEQSGGLTIDNSTAENFTTIYAICESPKDGNVIWVGTDDGNLQVTRDGGKTWTNVARNVPGLPSPTWVSSVEASRFVPGRAYVTFDGHRRGDMKPYVYVTNDYGATWKSIATSEITGYAHVIREDPVRPDLLFLGTEHGLYISLDGGARWVRFAGGLPPVSVRDLAIQKRERDLVIATHGRGIYIIDDLTPIRALTPEIMDSPVALLGSRPAVMPIEGLAWPYPGDDEFAGSNPPEAAVISYWLGHRHLFGDLKVEVLDAKGKVVTTIPGTPRRGINRVAWPMRLGPPKVPPANGLVPAFTGPRMAEGTYTIKLIKGATVLKGSVTLTADPRSPHSKEDRALQQKTALALYRDLARLTYTVDAVVDCRNQAMARQASVSSRLRRKLAALAAKLDALHAKLVATRKGLITGEEELREKLGNLYGAVNGYEGRPTASQLERQRVLEDQLSRAEKELSVLASGDIAKLNRSLRRAGARPLTVLSKKAWAARQQKNGGALTEMAARVSCGKTMAWFMPAAWVL